MYNKLPVKERIELMKSYRKANKDMSYRDMIKDYNDSYEKFRDGGKSDGMTGLMKSKIATEAHYGNPAALRMVSPNPNKYTFTGEEKDWKGNQASPAGSSGTHFMGSYGDQARPGLQEVNGKMQYFQNPPRNSKENFNFSRPEDAEYFAEHYKEVAPMMRNFQQHKYGGIQKFENGGKKEVNREPIITNNLNDPRLKAYSDSMNVYLKYRDKIQPEYKRIPTKENQKEYDALEKNYNYFFNKEQDEINSLYEKERAKYGYTRETIKTAPKEIKDKINKAIPYKTAIQPINEKYKKEYSPIGDRMSYLTDVVGTTDVELNNYNFDKKDPNFNVNGMKPEKWGKHTEAMTSYNVSPTTNKYGNIIDYNAASSKGSSYNYTSYSPYFKKPVQPYLYQPPEEPPVKNTLIKQPTGENRQWNFNGPNPVMEYYDKSGKLINKEYYKDMNDFKKGKKIQVLDK